jgi:hypothetical protein
MFSEMGFKIPQMPELLSTILKSANECFVSIFIVTVYCNMREKVV